MASRLGIKICGMTSAENLSEILACGPSHVGFICYRSSPRHLDARAIQALTSTLPNTVEKVLVTVNHNPEDLMRMVELIQPDILQMHGEESPELCASFRRRAKVWKVFGLDESFDFEHLRAYSEVDAFLFDTKSVKRGGTGQIFNWDLLTSYAGSIPFWLSGGIGQEQADSILALRHPQLAGVDLNSRFETAPGIKDAARVQTFIHNIKPDELSR